MVAEGEKTGEITQEALDEIALSRAEYNRIVDLLNREPNPVELGMFGALWSEHCGYKHSRPLLKFFPSRALRMPERWTSETAWRWSSRSSLTTIPRRWSPTKAPPPASVES